MVNTSTEVMPSENETECDSSSELTNASSTVCETILMPFLPLTALLLV